MYYDIIRAKMLSVISLSNQPFQIQFYNENIINETLLYMYNNPFIALILLFHLLH